MSAQATAFFAGAVATLAAFDLASTVAWVAPGAAGSFGGVANVLRRAGREGVGPAAAERRRLLLCGALVAFAVSAFFFGPAGGLLAAAFAPTGAARLLRVRRDRYRTGVEAGAADIAVAIADALSGGHSLRGAVTAAAQSVSGPAGHELRRVAAELALGAGIDEALEGMRHRIAEPRIDLIVAGALMQRRAGGDLASLLRSSARAFEDEARLLGEVKAATAQARFTGLVVVLLPLGGALLAELGSPGFIGGLVTSPLTAWLVGMAMAMQVAAAFSIRRLARIRA